MRYVVRVQVLHACGKSSGLRMKSARPQNIAPLKTSGKSTLRSRDISGAGI